MSAGGAGRAGSKQAGKLRMLPVDKLRNRLRLTPQQQDLVRDARGPAELLALLRQHDLMEPSIALLSYALPEREAVWWACMCILHTAPVAQPTEQQRALALAQDWVRTPTEEKRRQGPAAAREAGYTSAAAFTARAVFASRLADPSSLHAGRRVEGAIRRAADDDGSGRGQARRQRFIASALEIAAGGAGRLPPEGDE
jgi:hypothetical protein